MQVYQRMVQSANEEKNRAGGQLTAKEQGLDPAATGQAKAELERELAGLEAREERASDPGRAYATGFTASLEPAREAKSATGYRTGTGEDANQDGGYRDRRRECAAGSRSSARRCRIAEP